MRQPNFINKQVPVAHLMALGKATPAWFRFHLLLTAFIHHNQPIGSAEAGEDFFAGEFVNFFPEHG